MTDTRTLKDAVYGLAVGDVMGLPVQFKARDTYYVDTMTGEYSNASEPSIFDILILESRHKI